MAFTLPEPEDDRDRKLLSDVEDVGWHILGVTKDDGEPEYAFSIGMFHTLGHPEIVIYGLRPELAARLINLIGELAREGRTFHHGERSDEVAQGFPVTFLDVPRDDYQDHFGYALWFYRSLSFPVLQCVWPDKSGVFPWEPGFDIRFLKMQPILGNTPSGGS